MKTRFNLILLITILSSNLLYAQSKQSSESLKFKTIASSESSFYVTTTIIYGKKDAIIFDGMYKNSDGIRVANEIKRLGVKLKAIILSHADHDHYMGATEIIKRFPETPVYTTQSVLDDFASRSGSEFEFEKKRGDTVEVPSELIKPELLPSNEFSIDGNAIVIIPKLTGDVQGCASLALWIPSYKMILAGDIAFKGLHPWLGNSDQEARKKWIETLQFLLSYQPKVVIPGHKVKLNSKNSPDIIQKMIEYLNYYNLNMLESQSAEEVISKMKAKYPDLKLPGLMAYGAKKWFNK